MARVYFISQPKSGRIKIGYTRDLNGRLAGIANNLSDQVKLLGSLSGGRQLERAIHTHLQIHRLQGEWFIDCDEVRSAIADLLDRGPTAIEFDASHSDEGSPTGNKKFGAICRMLWPEDTVKELAKRMGCSVRGAQYLIDGERGVSAKALAAIVNEILN